MCQRWDERFMQENQPSIEYLELFALVAGFLAWGHCFQNRKIILFTDNSSVRDMVNDTASRCRNCMVLIRLLVLEGLVWNVRIRAKHEFKK